jgi:hypothetical protein
MTPLQIHDLNEIKKISFSKFNQFKSCNCCEIHKSNKPENLNDIYSLDRLGSRIHKECDCKCDCRHKMRWLCRIQNGFVPSDPSRFLLDLTSPIITYYDLQLNFNENLCSSQTNEDEA